MKELDLFTVALGLTESWEVADVKFSKDSGRLDLTIDFKRSSAVLDPVVEELLGFIGDGGGVLGRYPEQENVEQV